MVKDGMTRTSILEKQKHYLAVGGAGFIGSHLCDALLRQGHAVTVVDNLSSGRQENIEHIRKQICFVGCDITHRDDVFEWLGGCEFDGIFNLACPASPVDYQAHPLETLAACSDGTRNALDLAMMKDARFVFTSTSESYGNPTEHPQKESYWGNVNPIGPRSQYDEGKRFAEALTMAYHRTWGVDVGIVRIFNTYGPRMRLDDGRCLPTFIRQAMKGEPMTVYGDGTQMRSLCYVSDLVDGLCRMMQLTDATGPINLGNPEEITIGQLAEAVARVAGIAGGVRYEPLPVDDPTRRRPDISRAWEMLKWKPKVPLAEGLELTWRSYQCQG